MFDNVGLVRCIHSRVQGAGGWKGALGQERNCHGKELKPLGPVHRRDPDTPLASIVGGTGLQLNCSEA